MFDAGSLLPTSRFASIRGILVAPLLTGHASGAVPAT